VEDSDFDEFMSGLASSLEGKEFTRPPESKADIKDLYALALDLFKRTDKSGVKDLGKETLGQVINDISTILSKTYAEVGDYFQIADDEALMMIRDVLIHYNPAIINRNKKRHLPKS
jgi:hypothetical protein